MEWQAELLEDVVVLDELATEDVERRLDDDGDDEAEFEDEFEPEDVGEASAFVLVFDLSLQLDEPVCCWDETEPERPK